MEKKVTIIRVRRGHGEARYCSCENNGSPIRGFNKLSDIRKHWLKEIRWGHVKLIRELDKKPNLEYLNGTIKALEAILRAYAKEGR